MSNKAAVVKEKGARVVIEETPIPEPQAGEILIKVHSAATNPVDWKMQDDGLFVGSFPIVLGSDISGVIEAVGSAESRFHKGDHVAGFADVLITHDSRSAAFQQYSILREQVVTKLPDSVGFDEASLLPMAVATAGFGIFGTLQIPRAPTKSSGAFIVWGAASSVGSAAVQIARSLGFTVYAVNSAKHNDYIKSLGATECFDYRDKEIVSKAVAAIKAAVTKSPSGIFGYDAICEDGSSEKVVEILAAATTTTGGGGKVCLTLPYPEDAKKPDNIEVARTFAALVVTDQKELGRWLFGDYLEKALADKTFVPSPAVRKVEGGVEKAVQLALDLHKKGVSGFKPVLNP